MMQILKNSATTLIAGITTITLLGSCSPVSTESPFWATAAAAFQWDSPEVVSREKADALPYASVLAWFEGAPKAFIVLAEITGRQLRWQSADQRSLVTEHCFLVRTAGLPHDLSETRFITPLPDLREAGAKLERRIDARSRGVFDFPISSTFTLEKLESVEILKRTYMLQRVSESVRAGQLTYTNTYWVDPATGACWKSRQRPLPDSPELNIEVLKPGPV